MSEFDQEAAAPEELRAAIDAVIAAARLDGSAIVSGPEAVRLAERFAGNGVSPDAIYELLVRTAIAEGMTIEFRPPKP